MSVTAEIFLISTNVTRTNVAWTNVTVTDVPRNIPLKFHKKKSVKIEIFGGVVVVVLLLLLLLVTGVKQSQLQVLRLKTEV